MVIGRGNDKPKGPVTPMTPEQEVASFAEAVKQKRQGKDQALETWWTEHGKRRAATEEVGR